MTKPASITMVAAMIHHENRRSVRISAGKITLARAAVGKKSQQQRQPECLDFHREPSRTLTWPASWRMDFREIQGSSVRRAAALNMLAYALK